MLVPLFFLLLLCFVATGISKFQVTDLPGLAGPLPFELETGYVNIDDSNGIEMFYYFIKSEKSPAEDPLLFWFSGGPGCSGLNALMFGNGPFTVKIEEYTGGVPPLELNPYAWTKVSSVVYVDAPVGAGFSYSTTVQGSYSNDTVSAQQSYTFIRKWLVDHLEFITNSLLLAGDSYSGHPVPIIVQNVAEGIEAGDRPLINLKGYLLGNPLTYIELEINFQVPYVHGMGLISNELYESLQKNCGGDYFNRDPSKPQCNKDLDAAKKCLDGLWEYNTLFPKCNEIIPTPNKLSLDKLTSSRRDLGENSKDRLSLSLDLKCPATYGFTLSYYWANNEHVQNALNVRKGKVKTWFRCNYNGLNYTSSFLDNHIPYHANLSKRGIRSLIYSGDHDPAIPFLGTQAWIRSLNYSITNEWRPWIVQNKVAGYTRTYANNMTFATVQGAGHVAMANRPKECLFMYSRWVSYEPL